MSIEHSLEYGIGWEDGYQGKDDVSAKFIWSSRVKYAAGYKDGVADFEAELGEVEDQ